ncbi:MAG: CcmD family protein [Anaerolineae bacterium]|jgi:CcmD family protein
MGYLVAAYAVIWAVSFGLVFSIALRQRNIQSELEALRVVIEEEPFPEVEG